MTPAEDWTNKDGGRSDGRSLQQRIKKVAPTFFKRPQSNVCFARNEMHQTEIASKKELSCKSFCFAGVPLTRQISLLGKEKVGQQRGRGCVRRRKFCPAAAIENAIQCVRVKLVGLTNAQSAGVALNTG